MNTEKTLLTSYYISISFCIEHSEYVDKGIAELIRKNVFPVNDQFKFQNMQQDICLKKIT